MSSRNITIESTRLIPPSKEVQTNNIVHIRDAWYSLLLSLNLSDDENEFSAPINGLQAQTVGRDPHYSLNLSLHDYDPKGNLNTILAELSLKSRSTDVKGRLKMATLASMEISGGPDEQGRIGLDLRHIDTTPGQESRGFGKGLISLLNEAVPVLIKKHTSEWENKTVYMLIEDRARAAETKPLMGPVARRTGWTTANAKELGFTSDEIYVARYLGTDFLPLPPNIFVRVYQNPVETPETTLEPQLQSA